MKSIKFGNYVLQPADVVVARRIENDLLDHYLVYMGNGIFAAKMRAGVVRLTLDDLQHFTGTYKPVRMRIFQGNAAERNLALYRANACIHPAYNLLFSNCEHFADFIQYGTHTSLQSAKAGVGLIGVGTLMTSQSKNEAVQIIGGLSILAGVLALINEVSGANTSPFHLRSLQN